MKKVIIFIFLIAASINAFADGPFRAHRFDIFKVLEVDSNDIVFIGNSITDMHCWAEAFGAENILNRGNSGALAIEILENIETYISGHPKKVFLMIGTNDLGSGYSPKYVADIFRKIVDRIHEESPETEIFLESILPSNVGIRTTENEQIVNELIKEIANDYNATYIDLWDHLISICINQKHSLDGLHLKASGYQTWCNIIAQNVGYKSVYPENTYKIQHYGNLWGSHGMRATYFSALPIKENDILIFGDEMIKNGEWNELLHNTNIKNRGTGWGYDDRQNSIEICSGIVDATFSNKENSESPKAIFIYTGTGNINSTEELDSVKSKYSELVRKIHKYAPKSQIYLVSLMPTEEINERIPAFNRFLSELCDNDKMLKYVNIYSSLQKNGKANQNFFVGNYIYGKGYIQIARIFAKYIDNCTVASEKETNKNLNYVNARNRLGNLLYKTDNSEKIDEINSLLRNQNLSAKAFIKKAKKIAE